MVTMHKISNNNNGRNNTWYEKVNFYNSFKFNEKNINCSISLIWLHNFRLKHNVQ